MARPRATRWRWPPERAFGLRSGNVVEAEGLGGSSNGFQNEILLLFCQLKAERHVIE
jgi:hypothetical protein